MLFQTLYNYLSSFATIFLGIFIEAAPFLLIGTIASGLVEVFVRREEITRLIPRSPVLATLAGSLMGFAFPVCECGVVPLTRRLFNKGMPVSAGIAFLLAAPIVNPVVIASTFAAYGWGPVLIGRLAGGLIVSAAVGLVFSANKAPFTMMQPQATAPIYGAAQASAPLEPAKLSARLGRALKIAGDEFFEMGVYLVIGASLAALMQIFVSRSTLLALGEGPVTSVFVMQGLAYVLSVCSTVDAFLSLAFAGAFTTGSILAFLVYGPMVDIKNTLLFMSVFKGKIVAYLVLLPLLLTAILAIFINLNVNW